MRHWIGWAVSALVCAGPLAAQATSAPGDRRAMLQQIEEAFLRRANEELGLRPEQTQKLRATAERTFRRRREIETETQRLHRLLAGELRPGIAANQDSVARLTDSLVALRVAYAQVYQDEQAEMTKYLTPVQRAQYYVLRERLLQRVQEVRQGRRARALAPDPSAGP
ncbi:MAG: hypothetical protein ACHQXA_07445 [Gemmatimonadales bacterium]